MYDKAFVFIIPPNALTARYCYGSLWVMAQMSHDRVELVVDDWQTRQIITGGRSCLRDTARLWKEILPRDCRQEAMKLRQYIEAALKIMVSDHCVWRIWAPMFRYGNPFALGLTSQKYVTFDPSVFFMEQKQHLVEEHAASSPGYRERRWISASLLDKSQWLAKNKFGWPLTQLGNKKQQQERMPEDDIIRLYLKSWGVVSAPHDHAGSGWWRARYPFAALAGAILYGSYKDTSPMGPGFKLFGPLEVEERADDQLSELAMVQHATFTKSLMMSREALKERVRIGLEETGYAWQR